MWEVKTRTVTEGFVNTWRFVDENTPVAFPSRESAQEALDTHLEDLADAVRRGEMEGYTADDFVIEEVQ